MEELLGDEYYVELFAEIADSEPITEAIDEVCTRMLCPLRMREPRLFRDETTTQSLCRFGDAVV